jgi:hypothetical protein
MRAFTFSLVGRYPDGVTRPLIGEVGAPGTQTLGALAR